MPAEEAETTFSWMHAVFRRDLCKIKVCPPLLNPRLILPQVSASTRAIFCACPGGFSISLENCDRLVRRNGLEPRSSACGAPGNPRVAPAETLGVSRLARPAALVAAANSSMVMGATLGGARSGPVFRWCGPDPCPIRQSVRLCRRDAASVLGAVYRLKPSRPAPPLLSTRKPEGPRKLRNPLAASRVWGFF